MHTTALKTEIGLPGLPDERWMKAAVAGGLWAAFEIIIGSFLHNMKIPFAGSILASFGVMLMISFHRLWPVKGLIWRAGLICALMKSISPSALILGPMIGIMTEALLIELSVRTLGFNKAGYMLGGILGVCSALIHKVVSILILYGNDIFEVYLNIYRFALKQVGVPDADPWLAVSILFGVYVFAGLVAASIGISIPVDREIPPDKRFQNENEIQISPFSVVAGKYSLVLLTLHLISIPLLILLILKSQLLTGALTVLLWSLLLTLKYPRVYRRFLKPAFWGQFLIIMLIATFFWEKHCTYFLCFSIDGLKAGLAMCLRAVVVIMAFSALSIELRNPVVSGFLVRKGMRNLYYGISISFSALPYMVAQIPGVHQLIRHPRTSLAAAMLNARQWLENISPDKSNR